jgi:putative drug exporter of the RND superfamily
VSGPSSPQEPSSSVAPRRARVGGAARLYGGVVVWLRVPVLLLWLAAAGLAVLHLPSFGSSGPVVQLIPGNAPALKALATSLRIFKVPAGSEFAIVVRDPGGLSAEAHAAVLSQALAVDRRATRQGSGPAFALPLVNAQRLVPASRESGTTAITFLYYPQNMPVTDQIASARGYAAALARATGRPAGLTGAIPGQVAQGVLIDHNLDLIELITAALIVVIVAFSYRSVVAPLVPIAAIGVAFPITLVGLNQLSRRFGIVVPQELDPVVVALLLGIITDYSIFFLSGVRRRRVAGEDRRSSVRTTTAEFTPIILTSGLILSCGLLGLLVSSLQFFRNLGPALALTVAIALVVSLTLLPALLAVIGRFAYWPRVPAHDPDASPPGDAASRRYRLAYRMTSRPVAAVTAIACIAVLAVGANQLRALRLGFGQISDLPQSSAPQRAARNAALGFAPGILDPTTALIQRRGVGAARFHNRLARLESEIERQPGVAGVLGPREQPTPTRFGVFLAPNGNGARIVVIFRDDPLSASGIHDLQRLQRAMPALAGTAGLKSARISFAGDTAIADDTVTAIHGDVLRVSAVVLAVNLLLLIVFLGGIIAPVFLLLSSIAAVAAALGITTWVFQTLLGYHQLAYYVPFAVSVLLISLGSDYNVFLVGRIWQEARIRPLREAVAVAAPSAGRTIRTAGITLAASFAAIAVIPVRSFREVAFAMVIGLLLETFVVRSLLAPALIALFGQTSGWPGKRLHTSPQPTRETPTLPVT